MNNGKSDVARMRERIEQERCAFREALYGLVQVCGHDAINRRYHVLDDHYERLAMLVGDREANNIFTNEFAQVIEQKTAVKPGKGDIKTIMTGLRRH